MSKQVEAWHALFESIESKLDGEKERIAHTEYGACLARFPDQLSAAEKAWFISALQNERYREFVVWIMEQRDVVPEWSVAAMIKAAVYRRCPTNNRRFIEPVKLFFGRRRVYEELLTYAHSDDPIAKAGAKAAFYWAEIEEITRWHRDGLRAPAEDVDDLHVQMQRVYSRNSSQSR